jgi:hypothetical protein
VPPFLHLDKIVYAHTAQTQETNNPAAPYGPQSQVQKAMTPTVAAATPVPAVSVPVVSSASIEANTVQQFQRPIQAMPSTLQASAQQTQYQHTSRQVTPGLPATRSPVQQQLPLPQPLQQGQQVPQYLPLPHLYQYQQSFQGQQAFHYQQPQQAQQGQYAHQPHLLSRPPLPTSLKNRSVIDMCNAIFEWSANHPASRLVSNAMGDVASLTTHDRLIARIEAAAEELGMRISEYDIYFGASMGLEGEARFIAEMVTERESRRDSAEDQEVIAEPEPPSEDAPFPDGSANMHPYGMDSCIYQPAP